MENAVQRAVLIAAVVGLLAGCGALDQARLDSVFKEINYCETIQAQLKSLQIADGEYGRDDTLWSSRSTARRLVQPSSLSDDQSVALSGASDAPCNCPDTSLLCPK